MLQVKGGGEIDIWKVTTKIVTAPSAKYTTIHIQIIANYTTQHWWSLITFSSSC